MIDLAAVYAQVPDVRCKGLCGSACGPIACTAVEVDAMVDNGIAPPTVKAHPKHGFYTCHHLTDGDRCAIYAHRPLVCRLFGAVKALRCPHGCRPLGGFLSRAKAAELGLALYDGRPDYYAAPDTRDWSGRQGKSALGEGGK